MDARNTSASRDDTANWLDCDFLLTHATQSQRTLNQAALNHAQALKDFQSSAAKHFLGGADPADRIGDILNSQTRARDMADLGRMTANDPAARAGLQRAVIDHIFNRLQGNALAGNSGVAKLKSDQFQTFVNKAAPALHDVMTPQQVDMLRKVALTLQRDNLSVDATRVSGGSDTTQKAALLAAGAPGSTLLRLVKAHGLTGLLTILGAKMGGVGAFMGNAAGKGLGAMKSAGIAQTDDLVKEAMLNPALARVLLENLTRTDESTVARQAITAITRLSAARGAHTAVWGAAPGQSRFADSSSECSGGYRRTCGYELEECALRHRGRAMSDNEFVRYRALYDGQGNHRYGLLPPLMVANVLTEEFYLAKAVRPAEEWIALREKTDSPQPELGMVYMLPLGLEPLQPLPLEILATAVHLVETDKAVIVHADNPDTARAVKAATIAFVGVGHVQNFMAPRRWGRRTAFLPV